MESIYREIGHHQSAIELLQDRIAYHLGRISVCESQLVAQEEVQDVRNYQPE